MEAIRKKLTVLRGEVDEAKDRAEKAENEKREARDEAEKVRVCIYIVYMRTTVAVYIYRMHFLVFGNPQFARCSCAAYGTPGVRQMF